MNEGDSEDNFMAGNRKRVRAEKKINERLDTKEKEKLLFLLLLWLLAA